MSILKNIKIGTKVTFGFLFITVLSMIIVLSYKFSINQMKKNLDKNYIKRVENNYIQATVRALYVVKEITGAGEFRNLAGCSRETSDEISELSKKYTEIAARSGDTLEEIFPRIERTSELVLEISASSRGQNRWTVHTNSTLGELEKVLQQNVTASEEMASTAGELSGQAYRFRVVSNILKYKGLLVKKGDYYET